MNIKKYILVIIQITVDLVMRVFANINCFAVKWCSFGDSYKIICQISLHERDVMHLMLFGVNGLVTGKLVLFDPIALFLTQKK